MYTLKTERGQALIMIALAVVILFGFAALAIDGSRVFSDKRQAQNAADTAAIAAALAKIRQDVDYKNKGFERAASNGYSNGAENIVEVNLCSESGIVCQGLPSGATKSEYVRVRITSVVPTTFARVLGWSSLTNVVEAIARAQVSDVPKLPFGGAGLVAVRNDNSNQCFKINGTANVTIHDSGIFVNCTGSSALFLNGNPDIDMDADALVAGCANNTGFEIGTGEVVCNTPQEIVDASTFAHYPTTLPTPVCTTPGTQSGGVPGPGYYNSEVTISSAVTLAPGTYCFNAGVKFVGGSASVSGTGLVQFVLGGDMILKSSGNNFDQLEVYAQDSDFGMNTSSATLTANRLRFFGNGNSTFDIQNGTLTSGNAYIYSEGGSIEIQSQATANLVAPPAGDLFAGLLIHTPWSNTNPFILNGGTGSSWTGLVLVPHSDVTYNGSAGFELYGQVIGYTITLNGNGHSDIHYQSTGTPGEPDDPTIEFTK